MSIKIDSNTGALLEKVMRTTKKRTLQVNDWLKIKVWNGTTCFVILHGEFCVVEPVDADSWLGIIGKFENLVSKAGSDRRIASGEVCGLWEIVYLQEGYYPSRNDGPVVRLCRTYGNNEAIEFETQISIPLGTFRDIVQWYMEGIESENEHLG